MSRTAFSALSSLLLVSLSHLRSLRRYDESRTLSYSISPFCPTGSGGEQPEKETRDETVESILSLPS